MAGTNLGTAYVQIEPTTDKLVPTMRRAFGGVETEAGKSGKRAGEKFADEGGKGTGGVKGLVAKLGIIGLGLEAGRRFVGEFGSAISTASDLEQSVGGLEAVFKDSFAQMDESAKGAAKNLGISRNEYNELATVLGAGLKNKGIEGFEAKTQDLIGLGADLAAQYGGSAADAVSALSSLMRGESDPIERFGVAINETAIKAELAATGQDKLTGAALEQAKAQARLDILFRQTADAQGANSREADTLAGRQARMAAQWDDVKGRIGTGLLPVVAALTGWFSDRLIPAIDGLITAWTNGTGIMGVFKDAFATIGTVVGTVAGVIGDFLAGVGSILFQGDFNGGLLGLEEDHPVVDLLFNLRDRFLEVVAVVRDNAVPIFERIWDVLSTNLLPIFEKLVGYVTGTVIPIWSNIAGIIVGVAVPALETIWGIIQNNVLPVLSTMVTFFTERIAPTVSRVFNDVLLPAFRDVAAFITDKVIPTVKQIADFISKEVAPVVMDFADRVLIPAFEGIAKVVGWAWDNVLYPALNGIWDILTNVVGPAVGWLWHEVIAPAFDGMGDLVENFGSIWAGIWAGIQQAAAMPINFVIGTVWNNGLRLLFNAIRGVFGEEPLAPMKLVSWGKGAGYKPSAGGAFQGMGYATGGYTGAGGKWDPAGIVHRDEYVLTKEEVAAAGGPSGVEQLKRAWLYGYARGGAVRPVPGGHYGWNGGNYRTRPGFHGGLDFPAATGTPIHAMWAGQVSRAARLNTSYGHHAIVDHGDGLSTLYAHMSQLLASAGQAVNAGGILGRVGSTGNSDGPHLHLEVRMNGKRINPEPFLSGAARPVGTGGAPTDAASLIDVPKMIGDVTAAIGELTGPWGNLLKDAFGGIVDKASTWATDKLGDLIGGRGYASGTLSASRGLAWVGERGPELVNFRGGERVYNAADSAAMSRPSIGQVVVQIDAATVRTMRELSELVDHVDRLAIQHNRALAPAF